MLDNGTIQMQFRHQHSKEHTRVPSEMYDFGVNIIFFLLTTYTENQKLLVILKKMIRKSNKKGKISIAYRYLAQKIF